ncbi:UNVERIFIED_CONTAM: hypothetical protein FKN15_051609 [Acipenser sinensis]
MKALSSFCRPRPPQWLVLIGSCSESSSVLLPRTLALRRFLRLRVTADRMDRARSSLEYSSRFDPHEP